MNPITFASYRDTVRLHLVPAMGHYPLQRLSPQVIQGYFSQKLRTDLSPTTVRYHAAILREALQHAVRWGLIVRNPCDMVEPPRKVRKEMRALDEEQVRLFLAEAKRSSPYYPLYLAAVTTGMRQGELLGLRWRDVNLSLGIASVQQTFYRLGGQQLFKEPKSAKTRRTIGLPPVLIEEPYRLREKQVDHRRALGEDYKNLGLIFCQSNGKPFTPTMSSAGTSGKCLNGQACPAFDSTTCATVTPPYSCKWAPIRRLSRSGLVTPASA